MTEDMAAKARALVAQMTPEEKVRLLIGQDAFTTVPIERLGIPSIVMTDGPLGVRYHSTNVMGADRGEQIFTTSFPSGSAMGASWNRELLEQCGVILAHETRGAGSHVLLGPGVNIVRSPLCGRTFEYFSEDPYLTAELGMAYVQGLQGEGVGCSVKHFACNSYEVDRHRMSSEVDERALREIYLYAFERIVKEADPWTIMTSYNRINGLFASENEYLMECIARGEWGFKGLFVSDWTGVRSVAESINAGNDLEMPGGPDGPVAYRKPSLVLDQVKCWKIEQETIDRLAARVVELALKVSRKPDADACDAVASPEHVTFARKMAAESMVLLKNEDALLPMGRDGITTLAVIGPNADYESMHGGGSSTVSPPYWVNTLEGIRRAVGDQVRIEHEKGCDNYVRGHMNIPQLETSWSRVPGEETEGYWAEYFDNPDCAGEPVFREVLPTPWVAGIPYDCKNLPDGDVSMRIRGRVKFPAPAAVRLQMATRARATMKLGGEVIFNLDNLQTTVWMTQDNRDLYLDPEQTYDLEIEMMSPAWMGSLNVMLGAVPNVSPEKDPRVDRAIDLAGQADAVVFCAGYPAGYESEGMDRPDIDLPGFQNDLIKRLAAVNPNIVVVLNAGGSTAMPWLDDVKAVLLAHYPGMEGGYAVADILFGEANPSGKLSATFYRRIEDCPAYPAPPTAAREVLFGESLYVGYRHTERRRIDVLFPFGYGLSYTTFAYGDLQVPHSVSAGETADVSFTIKNTGSMEGKEVAQIYVRDVESTLPRPVKELKGFSKERLEPGEERRVTVHLTPRDFSYYDPAQADWVLEPGVFEILVGSSSQDIRLKGSVRVEAYISPTAKPTINIE